MDTLLDGDRTKVAVGAVAAGGALAAAKLGWERLFSREDPRRFRLAEGEPGTEGVVRIACGQLDLAIERLEGNTDEPLGAAVHEARKSFKRLRTTVRLARDELGDEVYRRENGAFRDAGRWLAGARDSQVLLDTLAAVSERHPDEAPPARFRRFRRTLAAQHASAQRRLKDGAARAEVVSELREARARVPDWPLEREGLGTLAPGLRRIYRRGRRAYRTVRREPSSENLHELRKRAKDLWYAAQILRPASPKRMKRLAREAHLLSDLIGEEHDLAILAERAGERHERFDDEDTVAELADLIERRRDELQQEALKVGRRLYRKKPRKLARPLESSTSGQKRGARSLLGWLPGWSASQASSERPRHEPVNSTGRPETSTTSSPSTRMRSIWPYRMPPARTRTGAREALRRP
jgi:CHAD domain-containing protein